MYVMIDINILSQCQNEMTPQMKGFLLSAFKIPHLNSYIYIYSKEHTFTSIMTCLSYISTEHDTTIHRPDNEKYLREYMVCAVWLAHCVHVLSVDNLRKHTICIYKQIIAGEKLRCTLTLSSRRRMCQRL